MQDADRAGAGAHEVRGHRPCLARLDLPTHDVQPVVVVPGPPTHAARLATALPTGSFDGPTLQAAIDRL